MAPSLRVHAVTAVRDRLGRPAVLVADAHRSQCRSINAEDLVVNERGEATERSAERLAPSEFAVSLPGLPIFLPVEHYSLENETATTQCWWGRE